MAAGLTFAELVIGLGAYHRKHSGHILTRLYEKSESENYMTTIPGVKDEYVGISASIDEVLQAWQCDWTPKGTVTLDPIKNKVRPVKVNLEFSCLEELERSYAGHLIDESKKAKDYPIFAYIIDLIVKQLNEDKELNAAKAVFATPTSGTAGAASASFDGFLTTLSGLITAGSVTPIVTGALSASGLFDKVETFVLAIPSKYRKRGGVVLMSDTRANQLYIDHRTEFGATYVPGQPFNIKIANTNITVKGLVSMEGSDRFLFTPKSNFLRLIDTNKGDGFNEFHVETLKGKVFIFWNGKIGYGFNRPEEIFCNEQS